MSRDSLETEVRYLFAARLATLAFTAGTLKEVTYVLCFVFRRLVGLSSLHERYMGPIFSSIIRKRI